MQLYSIGLAGALALGMAQAGPAAAGDVTSFDLTNGMQVVVIEDHRAPAVVQMVWYKIGSADEPRGHSGIAHFFEHLMFKGTDRIKAGEFSARIEDVGGEDNAFTSTDYTAYWQRVSSQNLDLIMQMESDRMDGLRLTPEDVATERDVILQERGQTVETDPGAILNEQMMAALYLNHPYGTPVIGWRHEMEKLNHDDALAFYKANYAPNNAILVVAGDVSPEEVKALAEKYYQPIPPSDHVTRVPRPAEPPQLLERRLTYADPRVSEPSLTRLYLAPERNPGDQTRAAALAVLAELLGGDGTNSFLARKLQFGEKPVAIWAGASYDALAIDPSTFGLFLQPAPGVALGDAEAALDAALEDFLAQGVDKDHLARIKTQVRAGAIYDKDDAMGRAMEYGGALAVGLGLKDIEDWPNLLAAVSEADVMAAAQDVLDKRKSVTGWLIPEEAK